MKLDKNKRYLILVESPEKARHITDIFKKEGYTKVIIMATVGHFTFIDDTGGYCNTGVNIEDFSVKYKIDPNKADNVRKLKEQVKAADFIFIASDLDREGESIAWFCREFLNIPKNKYARIRYHEITKTAIFKAIEEAANIDENMVKAAEARRLIDIMFGYRLSQIARKNVLVNGIHPKSVGRCQTSALRLIVERELEILNFKPEKYIDLYLRFEKNKVEFKAKYQGTHKKSIKNLNSMNEVDKIFNECKGKDFIVTDIEHKDRNENPKPPFCTATFQQEAVNKLGLTTDGAMDVAQRLFNSGYISYHRTDDEVMDPEFAQTLLAFVNNKYGKKYTSKKVMEGKKDENAQAGHECLRVTDLNLTPDQFSKKSNSEIDSKVYKLIYNRTIASAMTPAVIAVTTYTIHNGKHKFSMNSNELMFDGYRKAYGYKDEGETDGDVIEESFKKDEKLEKCTFDPQEKETQPKPRYKEAAFIKVLKEEGLGRPSTYATHIKTIKDEKRGYTKIEKKCFVPTELGMELVKYCIENFKRLADIEFTSRVEAGLDDIAKGKVSYLEFMQAFYEALEEIASKLDGSTNEVCPECGKPVVIRKSKYGSFKACSGWPNCTWNDINSKKKETPEKPKESMTCPDCKSPMDFKNGRYGPYWSCPKCKKNISIKKNA